MRATGAEGETAPANSQAKEPSLHTTLERGASVAPADGITISGERTEGASRAGEACRNDAAFVPDTCGQKGERHGRPSDDAA
jgi:hypothetical protein